MPENDNTFDPNSQTKGVFDLSDLTITLTLNDKDDLDQSADALVHEFIHYIQTLGTFTGLLALLNRFQIILIGMLKMWNQGPKVVDELPLDPFHPHIDAYLSILEGQSYHDVNFAEDSKIDIKTLKLDSSWFPAIEDVGFVVRTGNKVVSNVRVGNFIVMENNAANITSHFMKRYYGSSVPCQRQDITYGIIQRYIRQNIHPDLRDLNEDTFQSLENSLEFMLLMNLPALVPFSTNGFELQNLTWPIFGNVSDRQDLFPNPPMGKLLVHLISTLNDLCVENPPFSSLPEHLDLLAKRANVPTLPELAFAFHEFVLFENRTYSDFVDKLPQMKMFSFVTHYLEQSELIARKVKEDPYAFACGFAHEALFMQFLKNFNKLATGETFPEGAVMPTLRRQIWEENMESEFSYPSFEDDPVVMSLEIDANICSQLDRNHRLYCMYKQWFPSYSDNSWCRNSAKCHLGLSPDRWPYSKCCKQWLDFMDKLFSIGEKFFVHAERR